jgi:cardiolipin synthase A/B
MTALHVAIPILKGRGLFHLNKGRHWSPVEHLLLEATVRQECSTTQLVEDSHLPRRLVIEGLIRLMRAGWVQLRQKPGEIVFSASEAGRLVVGQPQLPSVPRRVKRWVSFVLDKITGGIYRARTVNVRDLKYVDKLRQTEVVEVIPHPAQSPSFSLVDLENALFEQDEKYVGYDLVDINSNSLFALVTIDGTTIRGLPPNEPPALRQALLEIAKQRTSAGTSTESEATSPPLVHLWERPPPQLRAVNFRSNDFVLGGPAQRRALERTLEQAQRVAIIHSTFIDERRFVDLLPNLEAAIARGVSIFVLWGKDDTPGSKQAGKVTVNRLRSLERVRNLYPRLIIDPFSTRSHAKILLADVAGNAKYTAVVGSCNWFSSGFGSFEASVRLSDAAAICDVVAVVSDMVSASGTLWSSPVMRELAAITSELRAAPPASDANGSAAIIVGAQHGAVVRRVRDEVKRRVMIASHRLGTYAGPGILAPLAAVVKARKIDAQLLYTTKTGVLDGPARDQLVQDFTHAGLKIEAINEPRLHAKILAWDDDCCLITSQNWLSADPGDDPSEVGVLIQAPKAADRLLRELSISLSSDVTSA